MYLLHIFHIFSIVFQRILLDSVLLLNTVLQFRMKRVWVHSSIAWPGAQRGGMRDEIPTVFSGRTRALGPVLEPRVLGAGSARGGTQAG